MFRCAAGLAPATMRFMLWSCGTRSCPTHATCGESVKRNRNLQCHCTSPVTGSTTCLPPNSLPPSAHDCNRYGSLSVGAVLGACAVLLVCGYLVCALLGGHLLGGSVIRGLRQCTLLVSSYMV